MVLEGIDFSLFFSDGLASLQERQTTLPTLPSQVAGATRLNHPSALLLPLAPAPPPPLPPQPQLHTHLLQQHPQQLLPAGLAMLSQEVPPNLNLLHQVLAEVLCMSSRGLLGKGVRAQLRLLQGWMRPSRSLLSRHSRLSTPSSSRVQNPPGLGSVLPAVPLQRQGLFQAVAPRTACPQPLSGPPPHKQQQLLHHLRSSSKSNSSSSSGRRQQPGWHPLLPPHRPPHARGVPPLVAPGRCPTTAPLSQALCRTPLP